MPYTNTTAEFRPELQVKVEEALLIDQSFIADLIFPTFGVSTRKGFYKRIKRGKGQLLSNPGTTGADDPLKRAPGTSYREITRTSEQDSWLCTDRGLKEVLDDVNKQEESRFFDLESSTAIWLMRNIRIAREARVAATVFSETNWGKVDAAGGTGLGGTGAYTTANLATFDFAADLKTVLRTVRKRQERPNTLVLSRNIWDLITSSALLRSYFFGSNGGNAMIDRGMIASKFELDQILVGDASYDTTKPGKDSSDSNLAWTWGDTYFWVGNVVGGAPELGGAGRTMILEDLTNGQQYVTETYRDEDKRSDILRVRQDDDTKIVNENSGLLCKIN